MLQDLDLIALAVIHVAKLFDRPLQSFDRFSL